MVLARPGMTGGGDFFLLLCPASALAVRAARNGCWLRVVNVGCGGCCCLPES